VDVKVHWTEGVPEPLVMFAAVQLFGDIPSIWHSTEVIFAFPRVVSLAVPVNVGVVSLVRSFAKGGMVTMGGLVHSGFAEMGEMLILFESKMRPAMRF